MKRRRRVGRARYLWVIEPIPQRMYLGNNVSDAELGPRGIRVNAVAPGVVDTDMSNFTKTEQGRAAAMSMQALKRVAKA